MVFFQYFFIIIEILETPTWSMLPASSDQFLGNFILTYSTQGRLSSKSLLSSQYYLQLIIFGLILFHVLSCVVFGDHNAGDELCQGNNILAFIRHRNGASSIEVGRQCYDCGPTHGFRILQEG